MNTSAYQQNSPPNKVDDLYDLKDRIGGDSWALGARAGLAVAATTYIILEVGHASPYAIATATFLAMTGIVAFTAYFFQLMQITDAIQANIANTVAPPRQLDKPTTAPQREHKEEPEPNNPSEIDEQSQRPDMPDFLATSSRTWRRIGTE